MFGTKRSIVRVATIAFILSMFLMALPINRAPALAYVADPVFSDQLLQAQLTEGLQWPDASNRSSDGQVAVFDEAGSSYGTNGANCPALSFIHADVSWGDGQDYGASVYLLGADTANGACQYEVKSHHTYAEEGHYVPQVSINDNDGTVKTASSLGIDVADAPLTDSSNEALKGMILSEGYANNNFVIGTFTDGDPGCSRDDYQIKVDWGDGTVGNAYVQQETTGTCVFDVIGTHTYLEEGTFNLNISATDHNANVSMTDKIIVNDASISSIGQSTLQGTEGVNTGQQLLATFHDADPGCALYDYHISINWGDGTPADTNYNLQPNYRAGGPCNFDVYGAHTYADENLGGVPYTGTVNITDAGTPLGINFTSDIADSPISTVSTGALAGFVEGAPQTDILIGTFHDTNPGCPTAEGPTPGQTYYEYGVSVNWGDGTIDSSSPGTIPANIRIVPSATGACNFDVLGTHTYAEENFSGYAFTAVITDRGGSRTSFAANIPVADALLTDVTDPNITGLEGIQLTSITVGQFGDNDPGCLASDYTAVINWGDGHSDTVVHPSPSTPFFDITAAGGCVFNVIGTHIYTEEGTYKAVVTVHDTLKDVIQLPATVVVNTNITDAPLQTVSNPASVTEIEGTPFGTFPGSAGPVTTSLPRLYLGTFNDTAFTNGPPNGLTTSCDIADYTATIDWGDNGTRPPGADAHSPSNPTSETSVTGGIIVASPSNGHNGICNFDVLGSYDYHEAGDYVISITVRDAGGAAPITWTVPIHVHDAALSTSKNHQDFTPVEGLPTISLLHGQPAGLQYLGTIQDSDLYCNAGDYTFTVNWGDGTPLETYTAGSSYNGPDASPGGSPYVIPSLPQNKVTNCSFDIFGRHVYNEESNPAGPPYHVHVTVYDDLAGSIPGVDLTPPTTIDDNANVSDAPLTDVSSGPTLGHDNNITRTEGIQFDTGKTNDNSGTMVPLGTIQDVDQTNTCLPTDYTVVSINWGDGTPLDTTSGYLVDASSPGQLCTFNVNGVHTYAEESEPNTPYHITVIVKDNGTGTNSSMITLHPTATIVDAPLTAQPGYAYSVIDSTYPYTSIAGPNGSVTGNGPNEQSSACWLLTKCTRLIATFTDTSTTCTAENETVQQHYTFSIDWGDGSTIDTTSGFAVPHVGSPCTYDVYGTHVYTTPSDLNGPNGFTASTTVLDEGGAVVTTSGATATTLVVATPTASTPIANPRRYNIANAYPAGSLNPTYVSSQTIYHYRTFLGYVGHIQFRDTFHYQDPNGLYIPIKPLSGRFTANCTTQFSYSSQCSLSVLSDECFSSVPRKTGVWWGQYEIKINGVITTRYVKTDLVQAGYRGTQDTFTVTMSSPSNPANYAVSTPPVVPVNEVQIYC